LVLGESGQGCETKNEDEQVFLHRDGYEIQGSGNPDIQISQVGFRG
jgi:hypothetical protein